MKMKLSAEEERKLKNNYYGVADKANDALQKALLKIFRQTQGKLLYIDEMNVLSAEIREMYRTLIRHLRVYLNLVAAGTYNKNNADKNPRTKLLGPDFIDEFLIAYNPVTQFVLLNEMDRRGARFAEALMSTPTRSGRTEIINRELRGVARVFRQAMIDIADKAQLERMKDAGVERVMWYTMMDERVCADCRKLNGRVFRIDRVPAKPHPNCRCVLIPYVR